MMLQDCFAPKLVPQLFVCEKRPVVVMSVMYSVALPASVRDTVCGGVQLQWQKRKHVKKQEKDRLVGARVTTVPSAPVPLRETFCGLPAALSVILNAAMRVPDAVGLNLTLMLQLAPAANELPHVWVCAKSPTLVPVTAMLVIVKEVVPTLVRVTVFTGLVVPIA